MENEPKTTLEKIYNTQPSPEKQSHRLVTVLVVLVVVLAAGVVGTYLWQHNKVTSLENKPTTVTKTVVTTSSAGTSSTSSPQYLYLYNYGLKIPLNSSLNDLYYVDQKTPTTDVLWFSTQSLANADPGCIALPGATASVNLAYSYTVNQQGTNPTKAIGNPFGYVVIQKTALPVDKVGSLDSQVGVQLAQANGYYLYYRAPQTSCSSTTGLASLIAQQKASFLSEIKGIQPIN